MQPEDNVIVPFAGDPAASFRSTALNYVYGLQPGATSLVAELASTIHTTLINCSPHAHAAAAKAALRGYLCDDRLLTITQRAGDTDSYRRHLLYADPKSRFSILAIVWLPGQHTPVHGHTAWGTVGVYEGNPYCEVFDTRSEGRPAMSLDLLLKQRLKPGDLSSIQPGLDDAHRIGNDSHTRCVTIHIYGRDLLARPGSINISFDR
jgi:predicted metal-dependent enzyme (double-stranded beta helix superfamily)